VPYPVLTCYHCEQAVEKILKAYLIARGEKFQKNHDLDMLLRQCEAHSPDFSEFKKICENISPFSTIRYPQENVLTEENMAQTVKDTRKIVSFALEKLKRLGFNPPPKPPTEVFKKMMDAAKFAENTARKQS